jgi:hypothetical protein
MTNYLLRYFFDAGSGVCLWSANDAAREKFDYPVQLQSLGVSENLAREAFHIVTWYDKSLDRDNPQNPPPWSKQERARFNEASRRLLSMLRQQLGPTFEICDESGTMPNNSFNPDALARGG